MKTVCTNQVLDFLGKLAKPDRRALKNALGVIRDCQSGYVARCLELVDDKFFVAYVRDKAELVVRAIGSVDELPPRVLAQLRATERDAAADTPPGVRVEISAIRDAMDYRGRFAAELPTGAIAMVENSSTRSSTQSASQIWVRAIHVDRFPGSVELNDRCTKDVNIRVHPRVFRSFRCSSGHLDVVVFSGPKPR